ncbi:hypothetical protein BH11MYX3_BH11MYX3_00110 [soil metagenome]
MRPSILLDVPVLLQDTPYSCGITALAAALRYRGVACSPADLAGTTEDGIDHDKLVLAARARGITATANDHGTIAELVELVARGRPVIVGWWTMGPGDQPFDPAWTLDERRVRDCGHYSVIHGVTPTGLVMMDPEAGRCELSDEAFDRVWYDTDTDQYVAVRRWYLVLE